MSDSVSNLDNRLMKSSVEDYIIIMMGSLGVRRAVAINCEIEWFV